MSFKDIMEIFKTEDYYYIVKPKEKLCIEMTDKEKAEAYANTFNGVLYDHYPYEEYGFEDPYSFAEEWEVITPYGEKVTYKINADGCVAEVLG